MDIQVFESWYWYVTVKTIASPLKQFEELENLKIFENSNPIFDASLESLMCVLSPDLNCSSIWNREKRFERIQTKTLTVSLHKEQVPRGYGLE